MSYPVNTFSEETKTLQSALIRNGFDVGKSGADGVLGQGTVNAIKAARDHYAIEPRGAVIDLPLLVALGVREGKKPNPFSDFLTRLVVNAAASKLRGLPVMNVLAGYRTYILAALIFACAAAETFLGVDIPEFNMGIGEAFGVALALITGRLGAKQDVAKSS